MKNKKVILIADDEPIGRQLLEAILYNEDFELHFAKDGKEALEKTENLIPDLILLDVMMPILDGFEVCKYIKASNKLKNIPIFLITALDDRDSKLKGLELGANDYISKPFDKNEILAKIKNFFKTKSQEIECIYKIKDLNDFLKQIPEIRNVDDIILREYTSENSFIKISNYRNYLTNIFKKEYKVLFYIMHYKTEENEKAIQSLYFDLLLENFFIKKNISSLKSLINKSPKTENLKDCLIVLFDFHNRKIEILNSKYLFIILNHNDVSIHEHSNDIYEVSIGKNDVYLIGTYNIIEFFNHKNNNLKDSIKNFHNIPLETQKQEIENWLKSYAQTNNEDVIFTKICF